MKWLKAAAPKNKHQKFYTMRTTIGEFFTWYNGKDWYKDSQTINTMSINGVHAQEDGRNGESWLELLYTAEDRVTHVHPDDNASGAYDISFWLDNNEFSVQSPQLPFSKSEDYFLIPEEPATPAGKIQVEILVEPDNEINESIVDVGNWEPEIEEALEYIYLDFEGAEYKDMEWVDQYFIITIEVDEYEVDEFMEHAESEVKKIPKYKFEKITDTNIHITNTKIDHNVMWEGTKSI